MRQAPFADAVFMNRYLYPIILVLTTCYTASGQNRYDNNWVFGRVNKSILLNFDNDSLHISLIPDTDLRTLEAHISMSDAAGNLLFYSNNCSIANAEYEIMENGTNLNPGDAQQHWCNNNPFLNPYVQSIITLPAPGSDHLYDVYHQDVRLFGTQGEGPYTPQHLYRTRIDMSQNNGLGKVIEKNFSIIDDTLAAPKLAAVRHANGRDWWLIVPKYLSNCYFTILIDPWGYHIEKQCLGKIWNQSDVGANALFTPEGNKYIRANDRNGINIFDFDRCSGELSNPVYISVAPDTNNICGLTISGSGRFMYFNTLRKIYQYDLEAPDIATSKTLVAAYDGFVSVNTTDFYTGQRAPDGKIYYTTFGPTYYLHTINHPDSAGLACEVLQHNILLPGTHYASVPNIPNYRLGALPGACDTIVVATKEPLDEKYRMNVYPNPSTGNVSVFLPEGHAISSISVLDISGRIIRNIVTDKNEIQLWDSPRGFYLLVAEDQDGQCYYARLVLE